MGLTDESAEGSRDAERAGAASWLLIFDWTAGAVSATIVFGSPWDLTSGDADLASVDTESARRTMTMFDRSFIFDICVADGCEVSCGNRRLSARA